MSIEQPAVIIALDRIPYTIPSPHTLHTPNTLPNLDEPRNLLRPIYLILPCIPLDSLPTSITVHLLCLATTLPSHRTTLLFLDRFQARHTLCYQTLFKTSSLTAHPARNLLSGLSSLSHRKTPLSIALPPNSVLRDLVLTHPPTVEAAPTSVPEAAILVAVGTSPPPTQTLSAIPGYKLSFVPSDNGATPSFLSSLHERHLNFLLRFPNDSHLFAHSINHTWHALLLLPFPSKAISCLNPAIIARRLKHPPRLPIHRPLLRLPVYHKPQITPPSFESAVQTVAHRTHPADVYQPPTTTAVTSLDARILSHRLKLTTVKHSSTDLKRQRFNRLHARAASNPKRPAQSVTTAPRKRLKTSYFPAALSTVLSPLSEQPKFYDHPYAPLSWKTPPSIVYGDDAHRYQGFHAIDFCDQERDICIQACENLFGKNVAEFSVGIFDQASAHKLKYAAGSLCKNAIRHELMTTSVKKDAKKMSKTATKVAQQGSPSLRRRRRRDLPLALPPEVEA